MNLLLKRVLSDRIVSTEIIKPILAYRGRFSFFLYDYILRLFETLENAICAELSRVSVDRLVSGSRQYTHS